MSEAWRDVSDTERSEMTNKGFRFPDAAAQQPAAPANVDDHENDDPDKNCPLTHIPNAFDGDQDQLPEEVREILGCDPELQVHLQSTRATRLQLPDKTAGFDWTKVVFRVTWDVEAGEVIDTTMGWDDYGGGSRSALIRTGEEVDIFTYFLHKNSAVQPGLFTYVILADTVRPEVSDAENPEKGRRRRQRRR